MFLLGASAGATAYSIEPPKDAWGTDDAWRFTDYMAPLFRRLVTERLIPSRDEVAAACPVAYQLEKCATPMEFRTALRDLDFDHEEGRLARAAYGVFDRARDNEFIPNDPRYGWIPVLPAETTPDALARFKRTIRPGEIGSVAHAREILEEYFPPVDRGAAWSFRAGPLLSVANSHEHWPEAQTVKLSVPARPAGVVLENGVLTWNARPEDTGFRVWRLSDEEETLLTDGPIGETSFEPPNVDAEDRFAVSALTTAQEVLEGTLHTHDFLALSAVESRRSPWVAADESQIERHRMGEAIAAPSDEALANEARATLCSPVEDLASPRIEEDDPHGGEKRAVLSAMIRWKQAIEREDLEEVLACYAPDYREPDGRTVESVEVAFRSILWKYLSDECGHAAEEWGRVPAWSWPVVRLLVRGWSVLSPSRVVVNVEFEMWAGTGPELEPSDMFKHPLGRENRMTMTWECVGDRWLLAATSPAFLRMEDTVPYRLCYQGW